MFKTNDELLKLKGLAAEGKSFADYASEYPAFYSFLRIQREQAIEICRNLKDNFLLGDENLPFNLRWIGTGLKGEPVMNERFEFDFDRTKELTKFDSTDTGISVLAMLMWQFDIKREELFENKNGMRKVFYNALMPEGIREEDLTGTNISKDGRVIGEVLKAKLLAKINGEQTFGIEAMMEAEVFEEISRTTKLFREATIINVHADEANNLKEVDSMGKKGKKANVKKKEEKKPAEEAKKKQEKETQDEETSEEESSGEED